MEPMGTMGLPGDGATDPKARGQWLQLRGEMLKAMGEVMLKHGQALTTEPHSTGRHAARRDAVKGGQG